MKKSIQQIFSLFYLKFVVYIPIIATIVMGVFYVSLLIKSPFALEREKVLFGVDIISATLAGLTFYASSAAKDFEKKKMYYIDAERFLHATILMSMATILEGGVILINSHGGEILFKGGICFILIFTTIIFFVVGLRQLITGLFSMMKNMHLDAGKY